MASRWDQRTRERMGPITAVVLQRTPRGWRYAIHASNVMDGRLDVPLDASAADAQAALVRFVEVGYGRAVSVSWRQIDQDWWAGDATFAA